MNPKSWKLYRELWYFYYHCFVYGKPYEYWGYLRNRFGVKSQIRRAVPRVAGLDPNYSIHLLCSHNDMDMLLWALASWYRVVETSGRVYIHEDGSFTESDRADIERLLPGAIVIDFKWANEHVAQWLAEAPSALALREKYKKHILIVKLIDPQFVSDAHKRLIIDTDILWFKRPEELLQIIEEGGVAMQYGDEALPFNSGIVCYPMNRFRFADLEDYAKNVAPSAGRHFIEQDGYRWILGHTGEMKFLNQDLYIIKPPIISTTVAKHFTGPRREDFWREGVEVLKDKLL